MATRTEYATIADLRAYTGRATGDTEQLDLALDAAHDAVDDFCRRRFDLEDPAAARTYTAVDTRWVRIHDVGAASGLAVAVDTDDDGSYETAWVADDWRLRPLDTPHASLGPGLALEATKRNGREFPTTVGAVQVTAKWGWPAVPHAVTQATLLQATRLWKRGDAPFGVMGNREVGFVSLKDRLDPDVAQLLRPYRRRVA